MASGETLTVVELYTSQGCSSCPAADAYLGRLVKRSDILPLSFHVDYWDYIGWKDPFADPRHTKRQRRFATQFSQRYVYTPQMIIHGAYQVAGSKPSAVEAAIDKSKALPSVTLTLTRTGDAFEIQIPASTVHRNIKVISVFFDTKHLTDIRRGENSGQKIANYNVVRDFTQIGTWDGKARTIAFKNEHQVGDSCAVLLQSAATGQIIGAAQLRP